MKERIANQAVVIGGSIAGLSAACALSPYFENVIIVERDERPLNGSPRKAVPQGNHAHALLKGGEVALESLFPGIVQDLLNCGAKRIDFSKDTRWYHAGHWKLRYDSNVKILIQSRPLLESVIRQRVDALGNVSYLYGCEVQSLKLTRDKQKIASLVLGKMEARSQNFEVQTDLLVDASGRGSKMPQWLAAFGFSAPQETKIRIDLSYSSRLFYAPKGKPFDWQLMVMNPSAPDVLRAGYIFPIENDQWLITFAGYSGDTAPKDNASFAEYAKGLAQPDIYNIMQDLIPMSDVRVHGIPQTVRRHYEKLKMPQGILVMGDASCAFDPVFGQGMSVAAQEAVTLSEMLAKENRRSLATLGRRFHKKAAKLVDVPWMFSSSEDFRYPNTVGERSPLVPLLHWYSQRLFELSGTDKEVFENFATVMHLLKGAEALFKPSIVLKVLKHAFASRSTTWSAAQRLELSR